MATRWTADQVVGLAPDAASVAAGRKLASPSTWSDTGCTTTAVWGSARGSGKNPYQVAVDLSGPAYSCSCPSRKIPCKHVLGLLLQWADGAVADGRPAAFAEEWLVARSERAEAAQQRAERRTEAASDPASRAARQTKRATNVTAGLADLDRFLGDLVGQGLAAAKERPIHVWEEQARRLVDAQAPALAERVRELGSALHGGRPGWPLTALQEAAALHLTIRGWQRADELPGDLRDDLRARVGWSRPTDEIRAEVAPEQGRWAVLCVRTVNDGRLRIRRSWLQREHDGRVALLLDFAAGGAMLDAGVVPGMIVEGDLHPYPGRSGLRVITGATSLTTTGPWDGPSPEATVGAALATWGAAVASDPLLERIAVPLAGVIPVHLDHEWWLVDAEGVAVRMSADQPWTVASIAGGNPIGVAGEWDGESMHVLTVAAEGVVEPVGRTREADAA